MLHIGKEIELRNCSYFDLSSAFVRVYLKPFDKYFKAAQCVFTSSCFENKHTAAM